MKKLLLGLVLASLGVVGCSKHKDQYASMIEEMNTAAQQKRSERINRQKSNWQKVVESTKNDDFCSLSDARLKLETEPWSEEVVTRVDREAIRKKTSIKFAQVMLATYHSGQQAPECTHRSLDYPDSSFNYQMDRLEMLHHIGLAVETDHIYSFEDIGITNAKFQKMLRSGLAVEAKEKKPNYRDLQFYLRRYSIKPSEVGLQSRHHLAKLRKAKQQEERNRRRLIRIPIK